MSSEKRAQSFLRRAQKVVYFVHLVFRPDGLNVSDSDDINVASIKAAIKDCLTNRLINLQTIGYGFLTFLGFKYSLPFL